MSDHAVVYEYAFTRKKVSESPAQLSSPRDTARLVRDLIGESESERLIVLWLDAKNHVIGSETVYVGNASASLVRVGELFRGAVRVNASAMVVGHNHPSGDPTPSPDDLHLTAEVIAAGRLLDIEVLDHVIVGEGDEYISLRDRGVAFGRSNHE